MSLDSQRNDGTALNLYYTESRTLMMSYILKRLEIVVVVKLKASHCDKQTNNDHFSFTVYLGFLLERREMGVQVLLLTCQVFLLHRRSWKRNCRKKLAYLPEL